MYGSTNEQDREGSRPHRGSRSGDHGCHPGCWNAPDQPWREPTHELTCYALARDKGSMMVVGSATVQTILKPF
jgi:hypothetical protein